MTATLAQRLPMTSDKCRRVYPSRRLVLPSPSDRPFRLLALHRQELVRTEQNMTTRSMLVLTRGWLLSVRIYRERRRSRTKSRLVGLGRRLGNIRASRYFLLLSHLLFLLYFLLPLLLYRLRWLAPYLRSLSFLDLFLSFEFCLVSSISDHISVLLSLSHMQIRHETRNTTHKQP